MFWSGRLSSRFLALFSTRSVDIYIYERLCSVFYTGLLARARMYILARNVRVGSFLTERVDT